jgi:hypothetical protein
MLRRLDWVAPTKMDDTSLPNLSVLSPQEYDRLRDLAKKSDRVSPAELQEIETLLGKCPIRTDDSNFVPVEIPSELARYWTWSRGTSGWRSFGFDQLRMMELVRFIELCAQYGWEDDIGYIDLKSRLVPLDQWHPDDQAEINALLDLADHKNEERRHGPYGDISRRQ